MKLNREQFKKSYERAKYQGELEGHVYTDEDEENVRKVAMGEMTRKELIEKLKKGR